MRFFILFIIVATCTSKPYGQINVEVEPDEIQFKEGNVDKAELRYNGINLFLDNNETNGDLFIQAATDVDIEGLDDVLINGQDDLFLATANATRMYINQSGLIGIGNTTPAGKMDIFYNSTVGNPHLYLDESGNDFARITMRNGSGNAFWDIAGHSNGTTPQLNFYYYDGAFGQNLMRFLPNVNNLEIFGDLTPQNVNYDLGNNNAAEHWDDCVADDFINFSDARLKEDIQPLDEVLPSLLSLAPVTYKYIKSFNADDRHRTGLLAQEVQKIFPSVVIDEDVDVDEKSHQRRVEKTDYLSMNYIELIPIIIKGMQEQHEIISEQRLLIQDLKEKAVVGLAKRVEMLEHTANN